MTLLFLLIGGAAGGGLGWLFDRVTRRGKAETTETQDDCETRT
jgi:hypothetical protein